MKIKMKIKNLYLAGEEGSEKTMTGLLDLSTLVTLNKIDKNLFNVNVRGNTIGNKPPKNHKVFNNIKDTLIKISKGEAQKISFLNKNNGVCIMCDSIKSLGDELYELNIPQEYHGFGNGQQTISSVYHVYKTLGITIEKDTLTQVKIMIGYNKDECYDVCTANNTNIKINNRDIISNSWNNIAKTLRKNGWVLVSKADKTSMITPGKKGTIELHKDSFYNLLNAYHRENPWKVGQEIVDTDLLTGMTGDILVKVHNLKLDLNKWLSNNTERVMSYKPLFDASHLSPYGTLKNLFITCHKKWYSDKISNEEFFDICFNAFEQLLPGRATKQSIKSEGFSKNVFGKVQNLVHIRELELKITSYKKVELV